MRLFVAAELDEEVRRRLAEVQRKLRYVNAKVTWVAPSNFHFTLKFLGETADEQRAGIQQGLEAAMAQFTPISCELRGLGLFPRVIWAGLHGETERLAALARRIDDELGRLGFSREEREFKPHLTLGRIRFLGDKEGLTRLIASHRNEAFGAVRVEAIHLFQSTLTPHGSIYTKLFTAHLKETDHGHQS